MRAILTHGSVDYEVDQSATQAFAQLREETQSPTPRSFPMLDFALQKAENAALNTANVFFGDESIWSHLIPPHLRTAKLRAFGFRLLSSTVAHIVETLVREGQSFPAKAFLAMLDLFESSSRDPCHYACM